jgi:hypothetical protein
MLGRGSPASAGKMDASKTKIPAKVAERLSIVRECIRLN